MVQGVQVSAPFGKYVRLRLRCWDWFRVGFAATRFGFRFRVVWLVLRSS